MRHFRFLILLLPLVLWPFLGLAQDEIAEGEDDNGFIINLLQNQLSTESRKIRLSGVQGALSSQASVRRITISDREGIWLQIDNATINWSRSALLRGRVEVQRLAAESIRIPRRPLPEPGLPQPEASGGGFSVPDLPVAINLANLEIGRVFLGEPVIGVAAEIGATGNLALAGGNLDSRLELNRLDAPGGSFLLSAAFDADSQEVALDLQLSEPEDGLIANLLNVEGRPAVEGSITASGPVADLTATMDFRAGDEDLLDGQLRLTEGPEGLDFVADIAGRLQPLVPLELHPFFAEESTIAVEGRQLAEGGIALDRLEVDAGGLDLAGTLRTAPDGFPQALDLRMALGREDGTPLALPGGGGQTTIQSGRLDLTYGEGSAWDGVLALEGLSTGEVTVGETTIAMGGLAENLDDPEARRVTARVEGAARDFSARDPKLEIALGNGVELLIVLDWAAGRAVAIEEAQLSGNGVQIGFGGALDGTRLSGGAAVEIADLSVFGALAGRDLAGSVSTSAAGLVDPLAGSFDLTLDGSAQGLRLGLAQVDPLLEGETVLAGRLRRDAQGIEAEGFRLSNDQLELAADGIYAAEGTDFRLSASVSDIGLVTDAGSGAVRLTAQAEGGVEALGVDLRLAMDAGELQGRAVSGLNLTLRGEGTGAVDLRGRIGGGGRLDETRIGLDGGFELGDGFQRLQGFRFDAGPTRVTGSVARGADGLLSGTLDVASPDISDVAALALQEASGAVRTRLVLSRSAGTQSAAITGAIRDLAVAGSTVSGADLDLAVRDLFGIPLASGEVDLRAARFGGFGISEARLVSSVEDARMRVRADAAFDNGATATLGAQVENLQPGLRVDLARLDLDTGATLATLTAPARLEIAGGATRLTPLSLRIGDGRLVARGTVAEALDLLFEMEALPLSIANDFAPGLGLGGTVSGSARVGGTAEAPEGSFRLDLAGLRAAQTEALGLPALSVGTQGEIAAQAVNLTGRIEAADALLLGFEGRIPLDPDAQGFAATATLERLAVAAFDRAAGNLGLQGRVTGRVEASGSVLDPEARFSLAGEQLSTLLTRQNGLPAAGVTLEGGYRRGVLDLDALQAQGPQGLQFQASGRVPLQGSGLEITAQGRLPLALANIALARSGVQVAGDLSLDAAARGALTAPALSGSARMTGGTILYPHANLRLENVALNLGLAGERVTITEARANFAERGTLSIGGAVGIAAGSGFPADLDIALRDVIYSDGRIVTTRLSGDLTLEGPILGAGRLAGRLDVGRTEVVIPSSFGINAGVLLDISHLNPPRDVQLTLDRAGLNRPLEESQGGGLPLVLDVLVNAPNQIFIRGRGLDAEMGGQVRVTGTASDVVPVGQINLIRGRLNILGQRIEFDEGSVTLIGDLNPRIRLVAETAARDGTVVFLTVEGPATDPAVTFSSSPVLPQDEVLALLIFDRNVAELSPLQIAQLAAAAASLAGVGGGGEGALGGLRSAIGLANLDVTSGDDGEVGVRAGTYVTENIYLDLEADSGGETKATINLDITDSVRARTSVDSRGESTIGIFFERDY
ncbi:translocation/assembly module TamB [Halovulum dunhuangense]|uniref:Translocation/assembly module TamB n=1 Tax=Halovulum dunhuangense TaxID=1505036 RepID=A0A849KYY7_9RHOB|nr:translocation/assembly module TamB domain-containing protein [Halovulum dunhuangense]NNU79072.1 translocation/assembly module TamB [Halovulum dunhuangense]